VTKAKIDRAFLVKIIRNPQFQYKVAPQNTQGLAQFLFQAGAIKKQPASWRDYFFDHPALASGS
jgi:NitT/TauT family transport system substrate-binding protein